MIEGVSHITFIVKDLDRTGRMFEEILSGKLVYHSGHKLHSLHREAFYLIGNQWIAIMEDDNTINRTYHHVAFKISERDVDYYLDKIKNSDLELKPPRERIEGEGYSIYFYDYDNNLFELHTETLEKRLESYRIVDNKKD